MKYVYIFLCFLTGLLQAQQTDIVDFKTADVKVAFNVGEKLVLGEVTYLFDVLKPTDSIFIDARNMSFESVKLNNSSASFKTNTSGLWLTNKLSVSKGNTISIKYQAQPKKALYFIDWEFEEGSKQIWTQGQGKYTSNWLPSIDDMNDKIEFDLSITFDKDYEVIANGKLTDKQVNDSTITWHYNMEKPMSSYLVALAIGKYKKNELYSKSGIPLELYYYHEDSLKVEPTYRYTKQLFDFLEKEIGVDYPWQNYKQVPVKDFLYAGMENTSITIFSDGFVVDSIAFVDKNYVNVNAHELAHQWFGDLVTETSGTHHWLQEGFATYYALLAERQVFGDDYYYWALYNYAQELLEQDKAGGSTALLNPKSSSATFYKKGAWVLHLLRKKVGDRAFKKGVKNYLLKHQFKNVETDDFITELEKASGNDLSGFVNEWLESSELHYDQMIDHFKASSTSFKGFLELDCEKSKEMCFEYLNSSNNIYLKSEVVRNLKGDLPDTIFEVKNLKLRQAIAKSFNKIPLEFKTNYESLLEDASYVTIEIALMNLWKNFPKDREIYLSKTKNIIGFNDNNIRLLWLTIALITEDFEIDSKGFFFDELIGYTKANYDYETRLNTFQYLELIQACNDECKENLKQATKHHNWRFSKFAKHMLEALEQN